MITPYIAVGVIIAYFFLLIVVSHFTSRKSKNDAFFTGNKNSKWYVVAFGMIGSSLSGVTFISVPGWVSSSAFSYMQVVFGYFFGYLIIANVLLPLYYKLNLVSIYTYLKQRFGENSYKTGAFFFILSRTIGTAFRLFIVANVLQISIFDSIGVPFEVSVFITIFLIWVYTKNGGIKTIIWTDTLQTFFMLAAVSITVIIIKNELAWDWNTLFVEVRNSELSQIFFFDDVNSKNYFWKQFLSGIFIAIVMTGLDQDMMQKNLTCKNLEEAQKNMYSFSAVLIFVNFIFLTLGVLLFVYMAKMNIEAPLKTDDVYPFLAINGHLGFTAGILFLLGLTAAAYSSADSAITALTTSVCFDFLEIDKKEEAKANSIRKITHIVVALLLAVIIIAFNLINNESVINAVFVMAGYTYGPLLGMFSFGLFTNYQVKDKWVPFLAVSSPINSYLINIYSVELLNGYKFGFELLIVNGLITFLGLYLLKQKD